MISLIENNMESIIDLCLEYGVERLEVFGSAAEETFMPERSDVDFVVKFPQGYDFGPWMSRYLEFRERLSSLLEISVDLVMDGAPRNPFFLKELNRTRKILYAA